jgi:hypothetical protein
MSAAKRSEKSDDSDDEYVIRLKDGTTVFGEAISALQKFIRRGMEREAVTILLGLVDSGFGAAASRRIVVVASEDIGLADPAAVAQACILATSWLAIRKDQKHQPDPLPLALATMLLCRAAKNREADSLCVVIREEQKRAIGPSARDLIAKYEWLCIDSHTARGAVKLRQKAKEQAADYEMVAWQEFLRFGAVVQPLKEIDGDKYSRRVYELFGGLSYDELNGLAPKSDSGAQQ